MKDQLELAGHRDDPIPADVIDYLRPMDDPRLASNSFCRYVISRLIATVDARKKLGAKNDYNNETLEWNNA